MALNWKNKPGVTNWTDASWNPVSGCRNNCRYCYLRRKPRLNMEPAFHFNRLDDITKTRKLVSGMKVFVGSSADMWADYMPIEWRNAVLEKIKERPDITFQFLTKQPFGYLKHFFPDNSWIGVSVDFTHRTEHNIERFLRFMVSSNKDRKIKFFISFEPILDFPKKFDNTIITAFRAALELGLDWVIIGANSNPGAINVPDECADYLIETSRLYRAKVFVKENYKYHTVIKEFPNGND
jgi:protein gp37